MTHRVNLQIALPLNALSECVTAWHMFIPRHLCDEDFTVMLTQALGSLSIITFPIQT
jgi:hypothetical protein